MSGSSLRLAAARGRANQLFGTRLATTRATYGVISETPAIDPFPMTEAIDTPLLFQPSSTSKNSVVTFSTTAAQGFVPVNSVV